MEKRREEISFTATDRVGATVGIGRDQALLRQCRAHRATPLAEFNG